MFFCPSCLFVHGTPSGLGQVGWRRQRRGGGKAERSTRDNLGDRHSFWRRAHQVDCLTVLPCPEVGREGGRMGHCGHETFEDGASDQPACSTQVWGCNFAPWVHVRQLRRAQKFNILAEAARPRDSRRGGGDLAPFVCFGPQKRNPPTMIVCSSFACGMSGPFGSIKTKYLTN
jgi:hypothetical protein